MDPTGRHVVVRRIEVDFPGWGVWVSDTGRWWAFRTSAQPLTIQQIRAGRRLIVHGDNAWALQAAISAEITAEREAARRAG